MDRRLFVLTALALGGCATAGAPRATSPAPREFGELEPLYSVQAGRAALTIRVASNGCTAKADFTFYVERRGEAPPTLAFGRKHIDPCKSFAMGQTELTFTWEELGLVPPARVFLLNPVTAWVGPGG